MHKYYLILANRPSRMTGRGGKEGRDGVPSPNAPCCLVLGAASELWQRSPMFGPL